MTTILDKTRDFLQRDIPDAKDKILSTLDELQKIELELVEYKCNARRKFYTEQERLRHPQEKGITDFDRRIMLNDMTADTQHDYELSEELSVLLSERRKLLVLVYGRE